MLRLALCAACLASIVAIDAHAQNSHYGMNAHDLRPLVADKMTELGGGIVRVVFGWDVIEPGCKGCFNWSGHPYNYPPLRMQDWYDFVFAVADRYKDDIFLWAVWNEPNLDDYLSGSDLHTYERLARTARSAIRAANPSALVLGPEVSPHGIKNGWYASAMRAFGDQFDIVTVHWFNDFGPVDRMMDDGVRPYSMFKSVWLSETGLRPCDSSFGETGQALFYDTVLRAFEARRSWWTTLLFYVLYDPPSPLDCGSGIVRPDWTNRPAFSALQAFIRSRP